jgi:hypothetical protein
MGLLLDNHGGEEENKTRAMSFRAKGRHVGLVLQVLPLDSGWPSWRSSSELFKWEVFGGVAAAESPFSKGNSGHLLTYGVVHRSIF